MTYSYDSGTNGIGRLTGVTFGGGVKDDLYDAHLFTYAYSYNVAGRVTNQTVTVQRATGSAYNNLPPINPPIATFTAGYQWDDEGRMTGMVSPTVTMSSYSSYPNPVVMPTMGYQYDINGRMTVMTSNTGSGPQTFASASYTPVGQLYQLSYGGMTETRQYNTMMQLISQSVPGYLSMNYNYSTTGHNNGRIVSSSDGITGENTNYTYDALNRLTNASNSQWSETYGYDGFGNLTSKTGSGGSPNAAPTMSVSYSANNQQTSGVSYDGNGNTSSANGYSYGYTVENKMTSATSNYYPWGETLYAYDPSGKRVMKETNPDPNNYEGDDFPAWEFYFYSITGQKLATMDCNNPSENPIPSCWVVGENVYFGTKMLVSNGVYVVTDRLGSVRANTQSEAFAYYPYGEERTNRPDGREKFGTYFRDAVGQDYAQQRYYSGSTGRFWNPDPTSGSVGNPGSMNKYAYVNGDPANFNDPRGLDPTCGPNGTWMGEGCYVTGGGSAVPDASVPSAVNPYAVYNSQGQQVNTGSALGASSSDLNSGLATYLNLLRTGGYGSPGWGWVSGDPASFILGYASFANAFGNNEVPGAVALAYNALQTPSCAALFGMGSTSPVTLIGQVQFVPQDLDNLNIDARTYFPSMAGNPDPGQYTIVVNTVSLDYLAGNASNIAATIIHELIHVAVAMNYAGPASWTQFDPSLTANSLNNAAVVTACGVGTIW